MISDSLKWLLGAALAATVLPLSARHHLFAPVPAHQLRELAADRPDATESPQTVDAGHLQIETSLYELERDGSRNTHTFFATVLKLGLADSADLHLGFASFIKDEADGSEGFSDIDLGFKWNMWGNDGGRTGFALFPYVKIPTSTAVSNGEWEGGLMLPFAMNLGEGWDLGLMAAVDVVDGGASSHQFEFRHTAVIGHELTERTAAFLEYIGVAAEDRYQASLATGFTYMWHDNLMLDIGVTTGLNRHAPDFGLFTGSTVRF